MEKAPSSPVVLPIDQEGEFSYEELKSKKFSPEDYLVMLQEERTKL
eukprot:CAMPEP_0170489236 /NCGR_PEP_ID=MMETSP0208-20121228/7623_1 /TAXON_ID=197538 /ORGANISM="Strombidium inclinatum, Strain S3" /LENGTH=45 /DNA_ID= /DNA_START= /DNA_END= /DNA_ORIENTATION=